jgi:hypothetical protein
MVGMSAVKDRVAVQSQIDDVALLDVGMLARRLGVGERFVRRLVDERRVRSSRSASSCGSIQWRSTIGFSASGCRTRGLATGVMSHEVMTDRGRRVGSAFAGAFVEAGLAAADSTRSGRGR